MCPSCYILEDVPLADMHTSLLTRCGSQRNSSRQSMVHWPTTGFLPKGLWSTTFSTMGGAYISSLGRSLDTSNAAHGISSGSDWRFCRQAKKNGYHFEEQYRSGEVGVLFEVFDDRCLNDFTATFHDQTGGGHCGQLVGLHVP